VRSLLSTGKRRRIAKNDRNVVAENPATAALEAALTFEYDYDADFLFEPVKFSLLPTCNELCFLPTDCTPSLTCAKQHTNMSLVSVHSVNEMTFALAYLSTASKAA
jgi:hypothetical protein